METSDLMIGDWVMYDNEPHQIQEIIYGGVTIECWPKDISEIEPIPITPEILEKNGFKRTEVYEKYEWSERNSEIWVIMGDSNDDEKRNVIHIDGWQHRIPVCYHNIIIYIHELQHALRLCKIDKEIIL